MDRGPRGPHITCATNRKQRVDMQRHVETGQFAQDAHSILLEVLMKSVLTMECAPYDQVRKNSCGRVVEVHEAGGPVLFRRGVPRPPPRGETTLKPPRATRTMPAPPRCGNNAPAGGAAGAQAAPARAAPPRLDIAGAYFLYAGRLLDTSPHSHEAV